MPAFRSTEYTISTLIVHGYTMINGMCNFARDVPAGVHIHDYRRTGEGVGETGEKERKEERGIRAKKDGTQTK